jgi:hypothetical protein
MLELAQLWEELIGEVTAENALPNGANADDHPSFAKTSSCVLCHGDATGGRRGGLGG